jgi:hypothetical protein
LLRPTDPTRPPRPTPAAGRRRRLRGRSHPLVRRRHRRHQLRRHPRRVRATPARRLRLRRLRSTCRLRRLIHPSRHHLAGAAAALEVALGGTPSPGIVIGGGVYQSMVFSPRVDEYQLGGATLQADYESDSADLVLVAFFLDAYLDPRGGFHVQAGVGPARMVVGAADDCSQLESFGGCLSLAGQEVDGLGLMLGVGYEIWAEEQWGVGLLGRLLYAAVSGDAEASFSAQEVEVDHSVVAPALLFSATLH